MQLKRLRLAKRRGEPDIESTKKASPIKLGGGKRGTAEERIAIKSRDKEMPMKKGAEKVE